MQGHLSVSRATSNQLDDWVSEEWLADCLSYRRRRLRSSSGSGSIIVCYREAVMIK